MRPGEQRRSSARGEAKLLTVAFILPYNYISLLTSAAEAALSSLLIKTPLSKSLKREGLTLHGIYPGLLDLL